MSSSGLRVVFFGNSESIFSNRHFRALENSDCRIVAGVDTPPSARNTTNTASSDIPIFISRATPLGFRVFEPENPNRGPFVAVMKDLRPDLFLAAGYVKLLKKELLSVPSFLAVNFHASLLPAYRGKHPVFWALRNGEKSVGLSVHVMSEELDKGNIIYQVSVRTRRDDDIAHLYKRIMDKSESLVDRLIEDAKLGRINARKQPQRGASYYSSTNKDDFRLNWHLDAGVLSRWVSATPGRCFFEYDGQEVFIESAEVEMSPCKHEPGRVERLSSRSFLVASKEYRLRIRTARLDGGEVQNAGALALNLGIRAGSVL